MYKAIDIAQWFHERALADAKNFDDFDMTQMKLQKLLYYTQGYYSGIYGEKLFDDDIEAWQHGPVVREVYFQQKQIDGTTSGLKFSQDIRNLLEAVYAEYGQYSAFKLREMTHNEEPWKKTNKNGIIEFSVVREFFKNTLVKNPNQATIDAINEKSNGYSFSNVKELFNHLEK